MKCSGCRKSWRQWKNKLPYCWYIRSLIDAYLNGMKSVVLPLLCFFFLQQVCAQNPRLVLPIGHPQGVTDIRVTTDGKYLLSRSFNDIGTKVWDTRTGKLLHNLTIPDGSSLMRISPSGKHVLLSGEHDSSFIFNLITGEIDVCIMTTCEFGGAWNEIREWDCECSGEANLRMAAI